MFDLGDAPIDDTLYLPFDTYDSDGASVTITGLAVTDIEIYKDGVATTRASDNGYALLDTDKRRLYMRRLDYDIIEAEQHIQAAGLPDTNGQRLHWGR